MPGCKPLLMRVLWLLWCRRVQQAVQIDDFARCVRDDQLTRVPGEMGRRDMVIIEAIYASAAQGGKRVEIAV